jgi:hypothetical protein
VSKPEAVAIPKPEDLEGLRDFIKKYPAGKAPLVGPPPDTATSPPDEKEPPVGDPTRPRKPTKGFFGVAPEPATKG